MKQFSFVLNLLLVVAVAVLFYLHFKGEKKNSAQGNAQLGYRSKDSCGEKIPLVAYVELDSLNNKVDFIKKRKKELEGEQRDIATEYDNAYRQLAAHRDNFLKKGNAITQQEAEAFQAQLGQKQQEIEAGKQNKAQRLAEKGAKVMEDMQAKVRTFMKVYNKTRNYSYILATGTGLDYIFYKDSALNITDDVVKGLNAEMKDTAKQ